MQTWIACAARLSLTIDFPDGETMLSSAVILFDAVIAVWLAPSNIAGVAGKLISVDCCLVFQLNEILSI